MKSRTWTTLGVANGTSETRRDAETGILKSESETKKCSGLIEKQICGQQTQNLRFREPLVGCARFRHLGKICRDFQRTIHHPSHSEIAEMMLHNLRYDTPSIKYYY